MVIHMKLTDRLIPAFGSGFVKSFRPAFYGCLVVALSFVASVQAQKVIWQETFEDDGEESRYVTEGAGAFEVAQFADNSVPDNQAGPVYWTRVTDGRPSFVGVPAPTPERRIVMAWGSGISPDDITNDFWTHFDAVVAWLLRGKSNAKILYSGLGGEGYQAFASRLVSLGHTVEEDDTGSSLPESGIDMYVYSGGSLSRFVNYEVPGLHYNSGDLDDELLGSIGTPLTITLPEITITAPEHPSAGGQTGTFPFVLNENTFQSLGFELPGGSTVVAAFIREVSASVRDLEAADALFDGSTPNTSVTRTATSVADIVNEVLPASQLPLFDWDHPIAGAPDGGFAIRATGKIEASRGTVSLAMGVDDGARLRIDLNGDGLDAGDTIIIMDRRGAFQYSAPTDVEFTSAGTFDFEWISFNDTGDFGAEILVAVEAGGNAPNVSEDDWDLLSADSQHVKLSGDITVETYVSNQEVSTPFSMALEAPGDGGAVFGGGPFGNFEGNHFFAGSALNKFTGDDGVGNPKKIIWKDPIDISGRENVKLTIALGATFLDFETGDFFQVFIDDSDDPFMWFTAPSGNDKFFNDVNTNPSNPTRLGLDLQDITYDIPAGVNTINLRIESVTTWWNEIVAFDNIRITSSDIAISGIAVENGQVVINFTGTLQSATDVAGPYTPVDGATSPFTMDASGATRFYIVR
ncbi:MAG: hypothetical protein M2R45_02809 [Verrucomicrobia subdivision 3 bacterium]|nr:hypothetical protein [Limisphaerales bacterium]MCS1414361.1 hypothetical protein [Limisphaerales bacterium]